MFNLILIPTFFVICVLLIYNYLRRNHNHWHSMGVWGPKPTLFFGNLIEVFRKPLSEVEEERFKKFGRIHGFYEFNTPVLTVGEPELIKQIMVKDFNSFVNRRTLRVSSKFFNSFLITIRDDNWKRLRAITSPTFSSGKMKTMFSMIEECVDSVAKKLDEFAVNGTEVDLKWLFGSYTMNVIAKCAFATNVNALEDRNNPFVLWASKVINAPLWRQIFHLMMPAVILDGLGFTIATPGSFEFFVNVAKHVLNERKSNPDSKQFNDFLQLLVDAERSEEPVTEDSNETNDELIANKNALKLGSNVSKKLSEEEIISNIVLFLLAGYETTASLLSFTAYNLALNSESQEKLYAELKSCPALTYESVSKLLYLDAVISESLRLNNPVTRVEREANEDYELGSTGIKLKRDSVVAIPIHAIHHDPEFYPDPHLYRPERFYGEEKNNIKPYTFLPFGSGPRNCIGMRFALIEAKLALARIAVKYKFTQTSNTEIPLKYINSRPGLLQVKNIWVGVETRN